jgi:hypothetical protein
MSDHPTLWKRQNNLLRSYVRDTIQGELQNERVDVLRSLLTDFHTARPRTIAEIANEAEIDPASLEVQLQHLGQAGLLRCINSSELDPSHRIWQISHDFIAGIIELVLAGLRRSIWQIARPWVSVTVIFLLFTVWLFSLEVQQQHANAFIQSYGFIWNPNDSEISAGMTGRSRESLEVLSSAFKKLKPLRLDFHGCELLTSIDALHNIDSVEFVDISFCDQLRNLDGLKEAASLRDLNVSYCSHCKI